MGDIDYAIVADVAAVDGAGASVVAGTGADGVGVGWAGAGACGNVATGTEFGSGT